MSETWESTFKTAGFPEQYHQLKLSWVLELEKRNQNDDDDEDGKSDDEEEDGIDNEKIKQPRYVNWRNLNVLSNLEKSMFSAKSEALTSSRHNRNFGFWTGKFPLKWNRDNIVADLQKQSFTVFLLKRCTRKASKIHRKHLFQKLFLIQLQA